MTTSDSPTLEAAYSENLVSRYSWMKDGREIGSAIATKNSVAISYSGLNASKKIKGHSLSSDIQIGLFS